MEQRKKSQGTFPRFHSIFGDAALNAGLQPYRYNGKEYDHVHGLNTDDYGARQYDSVLARWDRVDPLCEKYYGISPYSYCLNNPFKNKNSDWKLWFSYSRCFRHCSRND